MSVVALNEHTDISGSKSSLWDWQNLQQDVVVVKPIPSFESINELADRGAPTQHRSRYRNNSSKHKRHLSAMSVEKVLL